MVVYVLHVYRLISEHEGDKFPLRAYKHKCDALINCEILKAKQEKVEYTISSVNAESVMEDTIHLVSRGQANYMYPIQAFSTKKAALGFIYSEATSKFKQLRVDSLSLV